MFGCVIFPLLQLVVTIAVTAVSGNFFLGLISGFVALLGVAIGWLRLANRRHAQLMTEWAIENGLLDVTFRPQNGFITPPEMPWWMDWAAYDLWGVNGHGQRQHFYIFITGAGDCLFRLRMSATTDSDYITFSAADFGRRPLSEVSQAEMLRVMDEKRRQKNQAGTNSAEEHADEAPGNYSAGRDADDH
ncbi:unnamed protein product [Gemmata massiliana]|uniref:Uncharacterized protein n=1 Tax=Gemmata massiliana TaxID=1210884 RepID=A0A6P2D3C6_9BACT|nr:hypothetical protein [Gemmata massiliana]VTR94604.1 unnamed protein product [Gemmata massiliana]